MPEGRKEYKLNANEKRKSLVAKAKPCLGRNIYSQNSTLREHVFTPYKDGRYYSDCSSFVRWLYRMLAILLGVSSLKNIGSNTEEIINNPDGVEIECGIKNGIPTIISALRVGDLFLFRGTSRSRTRYVGHVEIVSAISGNTVTLMGHGSGHPKTHGMVAYCRFRQLWKVTGVIKNRGLICVKRFIADDPIAPGQPVNLLRVTGGSVNVRSGPSLLDKKVAKAAKGAILTRTFADTAGWYGVYWQGQKLYISKKYTEEVR